MTRCGWKGIGRSVLDEAGVVERSDGVVEIPYRDADGGLLRMRCRGAERSWWGPGVAHGLRRAVEGLPFASAAALLLAAPDDVRAAFFEAVPR